MKPLSITVEDWHSRSFSSYRGDIRLTLSSVLKDNKDLIIELLTTINMWHFVTLFFFFYCTCTKTPWLRIAVHVS